MKITYSLTCGIKFYFSCMVAWGHLGFESVVGTKLRGHRWNWFCGCIVSAAVCWNKIWMWFFAIRVMLNDCTLILTNGLMLQKWCIFRETIWMRSFLIQVVANHNFTWPVIYLRFFVQKLIKCCSWKVNKK